MSEIPSQEHAPEDVYIAVMGVTGAGKSSFIRACTGKDVKIGHTLRPETQEIGIFDFVLDGRKVTLIDTPGSDDIIRSDADNLRSLADWFASIYRDGMRLIGIIYLHSINSVRMPGSAMRNFHLCKALCGEAAYRSIMLVTTFWDVVDPEKGELRETEMKTNPRFWGSLVEQGSQVMRSAPSREIQINIVRQLVSRGEKVVLAIQREIVDLRLDLVDTAAGKITYNELERVKERQEENLEGLQIDMQVAAAERDIKFMEILVEERDRVQKQLARIEASKRSLQHNYQRGIDVARDSGAQSEKEGQNLKLEEPPGVNGLIRWNDKM